MKKEEYKKGMALLAVLAASPNKNILWNSLTFLQMPKYKRRFRQKKTEIDAIKRLPFINYLKKHII